MSQATVWRVVCSKLLRILCDVERCHISRVQQSQSIKCRIHYTTAPHSTAYSDLSTEIGGKDEENGLRCDVKRNINTQQKMHPGNEDVHVALYVTAAVVLDCLCQYSCCSSCPANTSKPIVREYHLVESSRRLAWRDNGFILTYSIHPVSLLILQYCCCLMLYMMSVLDKQLCLRRLYYSSANQQRQGPSQKMPPPAEREMSTNERSGPIYTHHLSRTCPTPYSRPTIRTLSRHLNGIGSKPRSRM